MLCIRGWGEVEGFPQGLKPSVILWSFWHDRTRAPSRGFCAAQGRARQIEEILCGSGEGRADRRKAVQNRDSFLQRFSGG